MKFTVEDLSTVKKRLNIEIPEEEVTRELNDAYGALKKNAKIKGFRPGKAPRSVLERLFKKDVHSDIVSKLLQSSFIEALKESDLNPIGTPKIDPPDLVAGEAYRYDAVVEITPEIDVIDFKGLELKKTMYQISDGEVDAQLKMLQKNLAERKTIEEQRPVQADDFVLIDYEGFIDGKPSPETEKTENFLLHVGEGPISKEFDDQLVD
jgi:trigger factor